MTEPGARGGGGRAQRRAAATASAADPLFDPGCARCPRLADFLADCRRRYPDYHAAPVPAFGDPAPRILIVGLAPGMHGANRTGRPFTGDHAGILLYRTLHELGFGDRPVSESADDPLRLSGVRITNAVKCLPPDNKPTPAEARSCNAWLRAELAALASMRVVVALGRIAHDAVLDADGAARAAARFAHGAEHALGGGRTLLDSYHCSRYNTQTRRLTDTMFREVLARAAALAG
ncbi:MAG: uracil-DNA glycosylase [Steroidobacteraceae bacterium]